MDARTIAGPLYYERAGRTGTVMAFLPPNPMDQSSWMFQMAHMSTWFRCLAIDTPGYGRSPTATDGVTAPDIAKAFWNAVDEIESDRPVILVGCSGGALYALQMHQLRPSRTAAIVIGGLGYTSSLDTINMRIEAFRKYGLDYRWRYTLSDFSPTFRATPMASYIANMLTERDSAADVETIIRQFIALRNIDLESVLDVACPTLLLTGTEDPLHLSSFELQEHIRDCELRVLPGAGHACHLEQPWLFDSLVLDFLDRHGMRPEMSLTDC